MSALLEGEEKEDLLGFLCEALFYATDAFHLEEAMLDGSVGVVLVVIVLFLHFL